MNPMILSRKNKSRAIIMQVIFDIFFYSVWSLILSRENSSSSEEVGESRSWIDIFNNKLGFIS